LTELLQIPADELELLSHQLFAKAGIIAFLNAWKIINREKNLHLKVKS